MGVKSEIHDCSIALMRYLFYDIFERKFFAELEESKKQRIDVQYYTNRTVNDSDYEKNIKSVSGFVLKVEKAVEQMSNQGIDEARKGLEKLMGMKQ